MIESPPTIAPDPPAANQAAASNPRSRLRLRISERRLLLGLGDAVALYLGLLVYILVGQRVAYVMRLQQPWTTWRWFISLAVLWLIIATVFDGYQLRVAANPYRSLWAASVTGLLASAVYLLIPFLTPPLPPRRLFLLVLPLAATILVAVWRLVYATVFTQPAFYPRALVIGAGLSGRVLARAVAEEFQGGPPAYRLVGFIDDDLEKSRGSVEGLPVLGSRQHLWRVVQQTQPDEIVVAITHSQTIHPELFQTIIECREQGLPVTTMASLYERLTGRVPVEHAGRALHVVMPIAHPAGHRLFLMLKRMTDILLGLVGCVGLLGLAPLVWLANRLVSPGDLFYRQERVGLGGRRFHVVKFRSMYMDAERSTGAVWAAKDDPRITRVGGFLRRTRLDEIPQFWNVLKGEMSLVGPRPERPEFVAQLAAEIPFYRVRHAVRPGITGWAQVKYRYGASIPDALVKLQYDLYYIKHQGPYLDLLVILKTIQVILGLKGR